LAVGSAKEILKSMMLNGAFWFSLKRWSWICWE